MSEKPKVWKAVSCSLEASTGYLMETYYPSIDGKEVYEYYPSLFVSLIEKSAFDKQTIHIAELEAENARLCEALKRIVENPTSDSFYTINNENNWTKWAKSKAKATLEGKS